jgi:acetate---CoA ligase (ADP-forming)
VAAQPEGIDLAILRVPSEAVLDTIKACVARRVHGAVCFASGFAEMGEKGRAQQIAISEAARAGGMTFLGPNTLGYYNYVDGFYVMVEQRVLPPRLDPAAGPAMEVVAQSGGIGAHIAASLKARYVYT